MVTSNTASLTVDLGLNIVAQPVAKKAAVTPSVHKKTNKYERRRQRGNKNKTTAKANTNRADGTNHSAATAKKGIHAKSLPNEASDQNRLTSTDSIIQPPPQQQQQRLHETPHVNDESDQQSPITKSSVINAPIHASMITTSIGLQQEKDDILPSKFIPESNVQLLPTTTATATDHSEYSPQRNRHDERPRDRLNVAAAAANVTVPPPTTTTNPARVMVTAADTAARAAYMAEFHARPMELDRRAGIHHHYHHSTTTTIKDNHVDTSHCGTSSSSETEIIMHWENLPLHARLLSAVHQSLGATTRPTTIQCQAISLLLQSPDPALQHPANVFLHSETGSGKTLAYLLPVLQSMLMIPDSHQPPTTTLNRTETTRHSKLSRLDYGTRCVVICPTRELAIQTSIVCERMCRAAGLMHIVSGCLGGSSDSGDTINDSRASEKVRLRKGLGIVVATPGRLLDHLKRTESLRTTVKKIQFMVLDEVDRLLDSGLGQQVQEIIHIIRSLIVTSDSNLMYAPWRSVFVSATITEQVQTLARDILSSKDPSERHHTAPSWVVVSGRKGDSNKLSTDQEIARGSDTETASSDIMSTSFAEATPKQLIQTHVTCSAKLRLTSLIAFLLDRTVKGETTVVFVSTCASVDYYHTLLTSMDCIIPSSPTPNSNTNMKAVQKGIFGKNCPIFKLHGNVPQNERQKVLNQFHEAATAQKGDMSGGGGSILFATDVAARGLNLPSVDWIVQFDVPCDVADYCHRAGRVARAGGVGHALLFLLPSEKDFLTVLEQRGIMNMNPTSLTQILNTAADLCKPLTQQGILRGGGSLQKDYSKEKTSSRPGEAFCIELQFRLEDCVVQDDFKTKAAAKSTKKNKTSNREVVSGKLIDMARDAFLSYIRAYPTKEKSVRHIFAAKALHLGHVARSFALKEPPKKVVVASQTTRKRKLDKLEFTEQTSEISKRKHLSFETVPSKSNNPRSGGQKKKTLSTTANERSQQPSTGGKGRSLLLANAAKLQSNGLDGL